MAKIALVSNNCMSRSTYLESCLLPTFYMEDFSILGFIVEKYDSARTTLIKAGYTVQDKGSGADIFIDSVSQVMEIKNILQQSGLEAELSDIADTVYQA